LDEFLTESTAETGLDFAEAPFDETPAIPADGEADVLFDLDLDLGTESGTPGATGSPEPDEETLTFDGGEENPLDLGLGEAFEVPPAPMADQGFIDDPDNTDWGFDELVDASDESGIPAPDDAASEPGEGVPDLSFDEDPLDLGDGSDDAFIETPAAAEFDVSEDEMTSSDFDSTSDMADDAMEMPSLDGPDFIETEDEGAAEESFEPVRPARAKPERPRPPLSEAAARPRDGGPRTSKKEKKEGVMPRLMKISIVLFAFSLVELGVYLFLRIRFIP
jgi:hypothetical protein